MNVVSGLRSDNKQVQEQLTRLQAQYNELKSLKAKDDATFLDTRAELREANEQVNKIRQETKTEMETTLEEKLAEQAQTLRDTFENERKGEEKRMENIVSRFREQIANQSGQIQSLTSVREELEAKSKHVEDLQRRLTDAEAALETTRETSKNFRNRNIKLHTLIQEKDNEWENKLVEQAKQKSIECGEKIDKETKGIIALHEKEKEKNKTLKAEMRTTRQQLETQVAEAKEEAQRAKDENEVAGNHKESLEQEIAGLREQLLAQQQQLQQQQPEAKLPDISAFETYGNEKIQQYTRAGYNAGANKINYFVRYEKDFVRHLGIEKAKQYLKDFADIDTTRDGSLNRVELARAYGNSQQKATQAIQALGDDIDLRTYMKWRRGDFHAHGEIERHPEDDNTMASDMRNGETTPMTMEDACQKIEAMYPNDTMCNNNHRHLNLLQVNLESRGTSLAPEEFLTFATEFRNLDTNQNGELTVDELSAAYQHDGDSQVQSIQKAYEALQSRQRDIDLEDYILWKKTGGFQ